MEVHCPKYVGKMHPSSLASISKRVVEKLSSLDVPSQTLVAKAIGQCCRDACLCSCSKEGCSPATIVWKSLFERWKYTLFCHIPFLRHYVLDWFEDVSAENELELPSQFRADVIRFETFEALGLSHYTVDQDLQANQDVDSHNHGPTDDTGSEERISDKAWYRILGEYHGWRKSWCIFLDDSNDEEG